MVVAVFQGHLTLRLYWHIGWSGGFKGQMSEGSIDTTAKRWSWHALTWQGLWVEKTISERRKGIGLGTRKSRFQKCIAVASSDARLEISTVSQLMFLWQLHFFPPAMVWLFRSMIQPWAHPVLSLQGSFLTFGKLFKLSSLRGYFQAISNGNPFSCFTNPIRLKSYSLVFGLYPCHFPLSISLQQNVSSKGAVRLLSFVFTDYHMTRHPVGCQWIFAAWMSR